MTSAVLGMTESFGVTEAAPLGISVRKIWKSFERFTALRDVSLDIGAGEFITLLGPSGSGKTTLLNIIGGFLRPDNGELFFGDDDVTLRPLHQRGLGIVFQNYALFPHMTVAENIAFPLQVRRMSRSDIDGHVLAALRLVQLDGLGARNVEALSGGQRQRVALARAIVFKPRIVLMDEPLSALDKNLREQMQVEIRHLHRQIGATIVYVTHDQREALTLSDRIAVMNKGAILQFGTPHQLYHRPDNAFVAQFIGETALLPVTRVPGGVTLEDGTFLAADTPGGGDLLLALRSENVLLPDQCDLRSARFPVVIRDVIFQGDSVLIVAEAPGNRRLAIRRPQRAMSSLSRSMEGQHVMAGIDPENLLLVPAQ